MNKKFYDLAYLIRITCSAYGHNCDPGITKSNSRCVSPSICACIVTPALQTVDQATRRADHKQGPVLVQTAVKTSDEMHILNVLHSGLGLIQTT